MASTSAWYVQAAGMTSGSDEEKHVLLLKANPSSSHAAPEPPAVLSERTRSQPPPGATFFHTVAFASCGKSAPALHIPS